MSIDRRFGDSVAPYSAMGVSSESHRPTQIRDLAVTFRSYGIHAFTGHSGVRRASFRDAHKLSHIQIQRSLASTDSTNARDRGPSSHKLCVWACGGGGGGGNRGKRFIHECKTPMNAARMDMGASRLVLVGVDPPLRNRRSVRCDDRWTRITRLRLRLRGIWLWVMIATLGSSMSTTPVVVLFPVEVEALQHPWSQSRRDCLLHAPVFGLLPVVVVAAPTTTTTTSEALTPRFPPNPAALAVANATDDNASGSGTSSGSSIDRISTLRRKCAGPALAAEQPVPGAYQQECMELAVRHIPVRRRPSPNQQKKWEEKHAGAPSSDPGTVILLEIQQIPSGGGSNQSGSLAGSTGTVVWNSSLLLTRLLERLTEMDASPFAWHTANKESAQSPTMSPRSTAAATTTVMELGCGTALVSLAAAALGADRVLATDGNPAVVALAAANVERNHASDNVQAIHLPWGLLSAVDYSESADLVLGSDLTYFSGNWPALAETMATVLTPRGTVLYLSLGHSGFDVNAELDGFLSVAAGYGLEQRTSGSGWSERALTDMLLNDCLTAHELDMIKTNGGVRVVALRKSSGRTTSF